MPYLNWWPQPQTRAWRQQQMQNWRCCFCGGRHAFWFHDHPGRDGGGRPLAMGHDELTNYQLSGEEPRMGISITVTSFYGVRVPDDTDWLKMEEDPGQCTNNGGPETYNGHVGYTRAGAYDREMMFLCVNWRHIEPGEYVLHSGEYPNANKFERDRWNADLIATAERLGLEIIDGPGWFTLPDQG